MHFFHSAGIWINGSQWEGGRVIEIKWGRGCMRSPTCGWNENWWMDRMLAEQRTGREREKDRQIPELRMHLWQEIYQSPECVSIREYLLGINDIAQRKLYLRCMFSFYLLPRHDSYSTWQPCHLCQDIMRLSAEFHSLAIPTHLALASWPPQSAPTPDQHTF